MNEHALIIFIKNSILGSVKTRLAADIGDEAALDAYIRMQLYTRDLCGSINSSKYLYYTDYIEDQDMWSSKKFHKMAQFGSNLGERMKHAMSYASTIHKKTIIIGSDCLMLKRQHIDEAFKVLNKNDVVLGPSKDGGYYLFGMTEFHRCYFEDIEWSSSKVLDQTLRNCDAQKAKVHLLEELEDVDYAEQWLNYKEEMETRYPDLISPSLPI